MTTRTPTLVCGVPIDDLTLRETVDRVQQLVDRGRARGRTHQVVTVNVDFLVNALTDAHLLALLQHADLAVPDGMPVVWGSKLLGTPVRERVAGADLVPALAGRCAAAGYRLYLYGGAPGIAADAAAVLRHRHPELQVGADSGSFFDDPRDTDPVELQAIKEFDPDILCVALGHPKQETWIQLHRSALNVPVLMGVGGSLDFLVGHKRRAPAWMQRSGTEWVHRAAQEPRRLAQRYLRDVVRFGPQLLREVTLFRSATTPDDLPARVERRGSTLVVQPRGRLRLDPESLGLSEEEWHEPVRGRRVVIDFSELDSLDHSECSALVGFAKHLADGGSDLLLASVRPQLAMLLLRLRLYGFLETASGPALSWMLDGEDLSRVSQPNGVDVGGLVPRSTITNA